MCAESWRPAGDTHKLLKHMQVLQWEVSKEFKKWTRERTKGLKHWRAAYKRAHPSVHGQYLNPLLSQVKSAGNHGSLTSMPWDCSCKIARNVNYLLLTDMQAWTHKIQGKTRLIIHPFLHSRQKLCLLFQVQQLNYITLQAKYFLPAPWLDVNSSHAQQAFTLNQYQHLQRCSKAEA